ncbi:MAG TPA: RIP metalloprotease RseP [Methylotenera sp.]|nr:RIP metalloprotease RseP [Methylotenera sp.]HPN02160.1 RIP metalloprotease RseP [Methylotenera sp.]
MYTLLAFIVTIGILVTVHEYGHFQIAKWCGVKVLKFSIGFGKPLWSTFLGKDRTEFIIAAIPLGGYVKFLDEKEALETNENIKFSESDLKRAFNRQHVLKRMAIVLAGPFANLLLAALLYWLLLMSGVTGIKPMIGQVIADSPAASAGFMPNDVIKSINGSEIDTWKEASFAFVTESLKSDSVEVEVLDRYQKTQIRNLNLQSFDFEKSKQDVMTALGLTLYEVNIPARIGEIKAGAAADIAGLELGDLILSVNQKRVAYWQDFTQEVRQNPDKPIAVLVRRNQQEVMLNVTPKASTVDGKTVGIIGVAVLDSRVTTTYFSVAVALKKAVATTWDTSILSLKLMGRLVTGQLSLKNMSGPVTIANAAGESADRGLKPYIAFLAFISISIGVMNLLPIPVLDGGHFMYYIVEFVTGKPVPESILIIGQKIGLFLLGLMMVIAFYNDIIRLITG